MNILVTGVGALIGYGIIESLRSTGNDHNIIATDIFEENYGRYVCDSFFQVPYTSDPNYADAIGKIIKDNNIDIVFPGIEQDLFYFAEHHKKFDTKFVLNSIELIRLSQDKWSMFNYLKKSNFNDIIPTYSNLTFGQAQNELGIPFIIKPKRSYAGKGYHIINSETEFNALSDEISDETIFQPYIGTTHEEYTIAAFGDGKGSLLDTIIFRRYLSAAGASEKVFVVPNDQALMKSIEELARIFKPIGPTNFQYRKQDGEVYLLEINPRISSACSLRTKFGYNETQHCLDFFIDNKQIIAKPKKTGKAIRYIADKIIYE